jgi:hypothetical protein
MGKNSKVSLKKKGGVAEGRRGAGKKNFGRIQKGNHSMNPGKGTVSILWCTRVVPLQFFSLVLALPVALAGYLHDGCNVGAGSGRLTDVTLLCPTTSRPVWCYYRLLVMRSKWASESGDFVAWSNKSVSMI